MSRGKKSILKMIINKNINEKMIKNLCTTKICITNPGQIILPNKLCQNIFSIYCNII